MDFTENALYERVMLFIDVISTTLLFIVIVLALKLRSPTKFFIISLCVCDLYTSLADIPFLEKYWLKTHQGRELVQYVLLSFIGVIVPVIRLWLVASLCLHFLFRVRRRAHLEALGMFILIIGIVVCFLLTNFHPLRNKGHHFKNSFDYTLDTDNYILVLIPEAMVIFVLILDIVLYFIRRKTTIYRNRRYIFPKFPWYILILGVFTIFIHLPVRSCFTVYNGRVTFRFRGLILLLERLRIFVMALLWILSDLMKNVFCVQRIERRPITKQDGLGSNPELIKAMLTPYINESKGITV